MDRPEIELPESGLPESGLRDSTSPGVYAHEEAVLSRDVYALLAQANLLRMRGHWEDAAQKCMAALRLAPDSSSANSLLGDIYENQGRYDDAAQWYRMALDANPDSPADRIKLRRLGRHEEVQGNRSDSSGSVSAAAKSIPSAASAALPSHGWLQRLVRDPEMLLRYGAIAAALGLVLVVTCAYTVVHHAGPLGTGHDAVISSAPVVVPPHAGVLPADPDGTPARDPSEQSLLTALQASRDLSALGIAVYDVQADPRISRTTITFGFPESAGLTQAQLAHDALRVLQAAIGSGQSQDAFTARGLLIPSAGNASATLAFVGDASQASLQTVTAAGTALTDAQALAVFTNVWWSSTADIRT